MDYTKAFRWFIYTPTAHGATPGAHPGHNQGAPGAASSTGGAGVGRRGAGDAWGSPLSTNITPRTTQGPHMATPRAHLGQQAIPGEGKERDEGRGALGGSPPSTNVTVLIHIYISYTVM